MAAPPVRTGRLAQGDTVIYVALAVWLFGLLLMGHGVYRLWAGMVRPYWVHWVLLPGSLVSAMGYIFGSLITGGEVRRASLVGAGQPGPGKGQAAQAPPATEAQPRLKVVGPIVASLIAIVVCLLAIVAVNALMGRRVVQTYAVPLPELNLPEKLSQKLPSQWNGIWTELDNQVHLARRMCETLPRQKWSDWRVWLFLYLSLCLLVRLQPAGGKLRATLLAPLALIGAAAIAASASPPFQKSLTGDLWVLLSFCWALLLLALVGSLVMRGLVLLAAIVGGKRNGK
jgi:hypothetical protein